MENVHSARSTIVELLMSLKGISDATPNDILLQSPAMDENYQLLNFLKKFRKGNEKGERGVSSNEIVLLGNLGDFPSLTSTSVQNWVKRDVKELIGPPELGKKYSAEQTALLLIVKDLKTIFDFETIRSLLMKVFNTISDRQDDLISPLKFYRLYTEVLDKITNVQLEKNSELENILYKETKKQLQNEPLSDEQLDKICQVAVVAVLAVLTSFFKSKAAHYVNEKLL